MKVPSIFVCFLTLVMYVSSGSPIALLIGALVFLFYLSEHRRWCRFYITNITQTATTELNIIYLDKDEEKELTEQINTLQIDKRFVWYKIRGGRVPYLNIRVVGQTFAIKQYDIGDWNEKLFDKVKNHLMREGGAQPT